MIVGFDGMEPAVRVPDRTLDGSPAWRATINPSGLKRLKTVLEGPRGLEIER
jgi:hypothetical protein